MTEHTKKILEAIRKSINLYEQGKIDEEGLEKNLVGNKEALEDQHIQNQLDNFINKIEESLYLFDIDKGKEFLSQEIKKLKKELL